MTSKSIVPDEKLPNGKLNYLVDEKPETQNILFFTLTFLLEELIHTSFAFGTFVKEKKTNINRKLHTDISYCILGL